MKPQQNALVVDQSPSLCDSVAAVLRDDLGFRQVATAASAQEALELLAEDVATDWIFFSWELPDAPGPEFMARVRSDPARAGAHLIMWTLGCGVEVQSAAIDHGVTDYLVLPVCREVLISKVRRIRGFDERRRAERLGPLYRCEIDIGFDQFHTYAGRIVNISTSGCLLRSTPFTGEVGHVLDIGTLRIVPEEGEPMELHGQIVRVEREAGDQEPPNILVAFEFTDLDAALQERLGRCIEKHAALLAVAG